MKPLCGTVLATFVLAIAACGEKESSTQTVPTPVVTETTLDENTMDYQQGQVTYSDVAASDLESTQSDKVYRPE